MTSLDDIEIRTSLIPGDMGTVIGWHGRLYAQEYGYGLGFESYVAAGLHEFVSEYDPRRDQVWICEHHGQFLGSLFLQHREHNSAQLRYFLIKPDYRGIGLGNFLMQRYMELLHMRHYASSFLWTTHQLQAAARLYRKHGFVLTAEKESTAFGPRVREQKYQLMLPDQSGEIA
jgi:peptidyl-dipeptidase Dcp